jgi:hypothetical protein
MVQSQCFLGQDAITWLTTDYGLSKFGRTIEEARIFYSAYISKIETNEELAELRSNFKDGQVLGNDSFLNEIRHTNSVIVRSKLPLKIILEAACSILEIEKELILSSSKCQLASYARGVVSSIAKKEKISMEEVANLLDRDGSTISSFGLSF